MKPATQKELLENIRDEATKNYYKKTGYVPTEWAVMNFIAGFDKGAEEMAKIAKEREARMVDLICELENYLQWNTDNLVGDDLIGDQRLTKRFNQVINNIHVALADHKRMTEGEE